MQELMDLSDVLGHCADILLPEFGEVSVILLLDLQAVAVSVHQKGEAGHHIEGIPRDHKHLLSFGCRRIAGHGRRRRICDPYSIRIACDTCTEHAHLCFHECPLDIHVTACVDASDLLQVTPHVSSTAPWEILEGHAISKHIVFPIKEVAFSTCRDLLQLRIS